MKTSSTLKKVISGKLFAGILLTGAVMFSGSASAQNLIVNPGFSNGTTGWSTDCSIEVNPEQVYGGNNANPVSEIDIERCFNQEISTSAGAIYDFSFKGGRRQGGTPATVGVTVTITGVQSGTQYVNSNYTFTNTSWSLTTQNVSFTVPSSTIDTRVNVKFSNYVTSGTYGTLVDDIALTVSSLSSVLPVKLISFNAEKKNNKSLLSWTASNDNNDGKYFIIERAAKQGAFDSIGMVKVSNVQGTRAYSFTDNNLINGTNNYRLKIVNEGSSSYSKIISLDNSSNAVASLYPNPATTSITLKLDNVSKSTVSVQVYSVSGSVVVNKLQNLNEGSNNVSVDITSLQPGSFFLKIADNNGMNYVQSFCKK